MADETRLWIAQCLCGPQRHTIAAVVGVADSESAAEQLLLPRLRRGVATLRDDGINPWCAICGADESGWQMEVGRTPFRSLAEAAPALAKMANTNAVTNALFGSHGPNRPKAN